MREDPAHRRLDARAWQAPARQRCAQGREGGPRIRRIEHDVGASLDRAHRRFTGIGHGLHGVHQHRIGVNHAREAQLAAQQPRHDRHAEGGRARRRVEGRHLHVRHHGGAGAGGDAVAERRQLDAVEPGAIVRHRRQAQMRVDSRVAVAGEVLQRGDDAAGLQPLDSGAYQRAHPRRILAERPDVDHRIARVVVDVGDGREVDVHADGARLRAGDPRRLAHQPGVSSRAEGHRAREPGRAVDAHADAVLEIGADEQRQRRHPLQSIENRRQLERLSEDRGAVGGIQHDRRHRLHASERGEAAEMHVADQRRQGFELGGVGAEVGGVEPAHQQLAGELFGRQSLEGRLDPPRRGLVEGGSERRRRRGRNHGRLRRSRLGASGLRDEVRVARASDESGEREHRERVTHARIIRHPSLFPVPCSLFLFPVPCSPLVL